MAETELSLENKGKLGGERVKGARGSIYIYKTNLFQYL